MQSKGIVSTSTKWNGPGSLVMWCTSRGRCSDVAGCRGCRKLWPWRSPSWTFITWVTWPRSVKEVTFEVQGWNCRLAIFDIHVLCNYVSKKNRLKLWICLSFFAYCVFCFNDVLLMIPALKWDNDLHRVIQWLTHEGSGEGKPCIACWSLKMKV